MIVVSDTTPLNYLILLDAADVLPTLFARVYTPSAVIHELAHSRSPERVRHWVNPPPFWLNVQDPTRIGSSLSLGPGETAAIALALELKADWILLDERKGSRKAEGCGLRVAGTLAIIEEAGVRNLLDYDDALSRLVSDTTFYVTDDVLRQSARRYRARKLAIKRIDPGQ